MKDQPTADTSTITNPGVYSIASGGFLVTYGGTGTGGQLMGDIYDNSGTLVTGQVTLTSYGSSGTSTYLVASGQQTGFAVLGRINNVTISDEVFGHTNGTLACFGTDTAITTPNGEVPVQSLRPGDVVCLAQGGTAPVVFLGHRRIHFARHPYPEAAYPIRIRAGSFGPNMPHADLLLSPAHAVFADGILVPVEALIDDVSISQMAVEQITYYHLLLDRHAVIMAHGLPVESLLDLDDVPIFDNHSDAPRNLPYLDICAPRHSQGPQVESLRQRLRQQALPAA